VVELMAAIGLFNYFNRFNNPDTNGADQTGERREIGYRWWSRNRLGQG